MVGSAKLRTRANAGTKQTSADSKNARKANWASCAAEAEAIAPHFERNEGEATYLPIPTDKVSCTSNLVILNISHKCFESRSII